jgi:hypothetical protein
MTKTTKIVAGIIFGVFAASIVLAVVSLSTYFSYSNREVALVYQAKAKQKNCMLVHDEMWKKVKEIGNVSEQYKNGFDSMYTHIISSRYSKGDGTMMKWIKEANPEFDVSLYKKLANTIDAERTEFTDSQRELLDVAREHDQLTHQFPGSIFLSSRPDIDVKLVTSSRTESSFASGKDDETYGNK